MRKILLIGATSAIAQETAKIWAVKGDEMFLVARNAENLSAVAGDLRVRGASKVVTMTAELLDFELHQQIVTSAIAALSGLDLVLLAHGTLGTQKLGEADYAIAEREYRTNFLSFVSLLTPIANYFEKERRGTIVVISSVAGDRGRQSNYIYGSAKGALSLFLQGLRNRLFLCGVAVITVKPGFVDTPMTAHIKKGPLFVDPGVVARGIERAIQRRQDVVYLPWFWRFLMLVIRCMPETIFKRMKL
jgi:short-subunit dehydrogenase